MKKKWICKTENDFFNVASEFLTIFPSVKKIAFYGEMGVGKTTFIKSFCKILNIQDVVTSPTFSIVNEYFSEKNGKVYHFDFYRLKNEKEAFDIGYEEYFFGNNYCFVEWPERILNLLTPEFKSIDIIYENNYRVIKIETDE